MKHEPKNSCPHHGHSRRDFLTLGVAIGTGLIFSGSVHGANNIRDIRGDVFVNRRPADPTTPINPGDMVTVAPSGKLSFVIGTDAYLLRGGSSMHIEKDDNLIVNGLRLFTGGLLAVFGKGEKTIRTPNATIGIRGAGIYLDTQPDKTYFCTCYGETELSVDNDTRIMTSRHHHSAAIYTPGSGKSVVEDTGMFMGHYEYHTDDALRTQEALVGRTVPFDS